jgi:hypothetical protein
MGWQRGSGRTDHVRPRRRGFTFDTIAPSGMRMSYRITEHEPRRHTTIELCESRMFRRALWRIQYAPAPGASAMKELHSDGTSAMSMRYPVALTATDAA